jgi:hypothetical protein
MQNDTVQNFLSGMTSMFEWLPEWAIAGGVVILAILAGVWAHRISTRVAGRAVQKAHPVVRSLF